MFPFILVKIYVIGFVCAIMVYSILPTTETNNTFTIEVKYAIKAI